jgi:cellulose biosynthesis protein BcsQ
VRNRGRHRPAVRQSSDTLQRASLDSRRTAPRNSDRGGGATAGREATVGKPAVRRAAVPGASLSDLDLNRFKGEYLPALVSIDTITQNDRSTQQQLRALRLIDASGIPTVTAVLMLGKSPQDWVPGATIAWRRVTGTSLTDPTADERVLTGPIPDQLRRIDEIMDSAIAVAVEMGTATHRRTAEYPLEALQQLVRNAVMHRTCDGTAAPSRVTWYADRVEILNPGGPFGAVTPATFGAAGLYRLSQPDAGGSAEGLRIRREVRPRPRDRASCLGSERQPAGRVRVPARGSAGMGPCRRQEAVMKTIAFFNNKGGAGKTSLLYHLANMLALRGRHVVAADFDPQAKLSAMFLQDGRIDALWSASGGATAYSAMRPLMGGTGDLLPMTPQIVADRLALIRGDLALSGIEDELSSQWPLCSDGKERAFRVTAAFDRMLRTVGAAQGADIGLIDVGPNLGAINRCALIAADAVVIPIGADLFSIRGLQNVGPKLREWRQHWSDRRKRAPSSLDFQLPAGEMRPLGYVISRYASYGRGAPKAFQRWLDRAPGIYAEAVLDQPPPDPAQALDLNRLAQLKDYRSLMPMAQEARKPMFLLKPADGAIGGHQAAVQECYRDFEALAAEIEGRLELEAAPA